LLLKWVLSVAIPDAPGWVTEEQARRTYFKKIAIEGHDPSMDDEEDDDDIEGGGRESTHGGSSSAAGMAHRMSHKAYQNQQEEKVPLLP